MSRALLIIDVQTLLCEGPYAVFDAAGAIARINHVSQHLRNTGELVVVIQHEEAEGPMVHGSKGWQLGPGLLTTPNDCFVRKTTPDAFHKTALQAILQAHGVDELIACGFQSDFCVDSTVRRALALGYPVTLLADAHSTLDNGVLKAPQIIAHHNETLGNMSSFGPRVRGLPSAALAD